MASRTRLWVAAVVLAAALGEGCNSNQVGDLLVSLITARFVPGTITLPRGTSRTVDLEITCDKDGLETPFGRLGVKVKLSALSSLPAGVTATQAVPPDAQGFARYPCDGAHADPKLRIAHVAVQVVASPGAPASAVLDAFVEIEPLNSGEPSKDSSTAQLPISVTASDATGPSV